MFLLTDLHVRNPNTYVTLRQKLKSLRITKGLTLANLATGLGYPTRTGGRVSQLIRWETGYLPPSRRSGRRKEHSIAISTLFRLAKVYNITLSELFEGVTEL